jgi:calcium-translocating P-type ATPase
MINISDGLTEKEAETSRRKYGENRLTKQARRSFLSNFLSNFGDPIIKVLLVALAINVLFLFGSSDWLESIGIAIAILLATIVATVSEQGSEEAFEKLQEAAMQIKCRVRRDGSVREIPLEEIVAGDIVMLQAGDRVPADGIIVDGRLDVDQSSLNGESKEAKKFPVSGANADEPKRTASNFLDYTRLFFGTIVCGGEGVMRVTEVGDSTFYGMMASEMQEETRESPLKVRLGNFAGTISKFGYIAAGLVAGVYLVGQIVEFRAFSGVMQLLPHILKAATIAVTVIVMAVPEGLPMMITVVLSANMKRMMSAGVLVRKLVGIETAGSLNILFTDKTGTLTKGSLEVMTFLCGNGNELKGNDSAIAGIMRESLLYNTSSDIDGERAIGGNATDRALLEFAMKLGGIKDGSVRKLGAIQFASDRKFMATTILRKDKKITLIKGAPERILLACTSFYDENGNVRRFGAPGALDKKMERLSGQAMRLIAVATSERDIVDGMENDVIKGDLTLVGLIGIRDEVRAQVVEGVRQVSEAGVQLVMITGDSKLTASAIARETGILRGNADEIILTSSELARLSDEQLAEKMPRLRVIARALPSDKSRLVHVAQSKNLVVGMTGDGVNDAPALKKADVGFAMGSGTEVAKEAGDIIILDDNINSISKAICYGRTIFKNIRRFIIYQLTISMGAVGISVIAPFIGVETPVTVIQMLWINIIMDTLSGMAFSGERAQREYMREMPKRRDEPIMNYYMWNQIVVSALYITALCLIFLKSPIFQRIFMGWGERYMLTGFFALFMFTAIFASFTARTSHMNILDNLAGNKAFLWIMGGVALVQVIIIYVGGTVFRTEGLRFDDFVIVVALALTIIPVDIIRKSVISGSNIGCGV